MVSSNRDENIAEILCDIYNKVGLEGAISIQQGNGVSFKTTVEYVEGISFESGFLSPYFA